MNSHLWAAERDGDELEPLNERSPLHDQYPGETEGAPSPGEARPLPLDQVSPALQVALAQAPIGMTGMRSVRAVGPEGQRYTAGLYDGRVYLLELPWPNPRNEYRTLGEEPPGIEWQPYSQGTRGV